MKELIDYYYDTHVIGLIKLSENVFKVKTQDNQYVIKIVKDKHLEKTYEYIQTLHVHCFVPIIFNKNNEILTPYLHQYFYMMPFVDNNEGLMKEIKIKFYFETLAYLHEKTFYYTKVNQQFFHTLQKDIENVIYERTQYYEQMIQNIENITMRSPSQWMFVMNYYRLYQSLCQAGQYLTQYLQQTQDAHQIRVCLNYKHFDYDHISLKQKILLSIDSLCIDLPIYDLFDIYQRIPDILFDLDCFVECYFKKITLKEEEKLLLCCLMNVVPIIQFGMDEIENIIKLSRLLYYLDSIHNFIAQL